MNRTKVAIVTGHASGLGYEITRLLLEQDWSVVGVTRTSTPDDLQKRFAERLVTVHGSVDEEAVVDAAFAAASGFGGPSLVVNSAGTGVFGEVGSYTADDVKEALSANFAGLIVFSDRAVRVMSESGGDIVNVMSTAGKKLRPAESVYCATKFGAKAYTRVLRDALKAQKKPIRVFEVYPCGMSTGFWESAIRPVTDGSSFPSPTHIAERIVDAITHEADSYIQELTFERS